MHWPLETAAWRAAVQLCAPLEKMLCAQISQEQFSHVLTIKAAFSPDFSDMLPTAEKIYFLGSRVASYHTWTSFNESQCSRSCSAVAQAATLHAIGLAPMLVNSR